MFLWSPVLEATETSVDSPYDDFYDHSKEEDLNDLEASLNESRRSNRKRAIMVKEGLIPGAFGKILESAQKILLYP